MSGEVATLLTDGAERQPRKRKLMFIRLVVMAGLIPLTPFLLLAVARARRATGFDALHERVREVWERSAFEAIAELRAVHETLRAQGALTSFKAVEIPPFGRFGGLETFRVQQFLYRCELAIQNYEGALAVAAAPGKTTLTILQQVDCLVAMGRRGDAIALLERNLDLDGWRGTLRRRLAELGGKPLRIVN